MFFINAELVSQAVINSLILCANKLIPSIFPFMVLSSILSLSGIMVSFFGRNKFPKFLGIPRSNLGIILASWLSGYVVGPKIINEYSQNSDITDYVLLTSNAGVGFVISYVGISLWNNVSFGIFLYLIQIIVSIIIFNTGKSKANIVVNTKRMPFLTAITKSVQSSTETMVMICGFTVFFSALKTLICYPFNTSNGNIFYVFASALLEISEGVLASTASVNNIACGFLTGFCVGFGGICMCLQTLAVCDKAKVKWYKFILLKLLHGIVCGALSSIFVFSFKLCPASLTIVSLTDNIRLSDVIINSLFLFTVMLYIKKFINRAKY